MQGSATHYDVLGLKPSCSPDEIKSAYRRLALKIHPDRGGDAVLFQLVQNAYDCLSDPDKRRQYDRDRLAAQRATTAHYTTNGHRSATTTAPPPSSVYTRGAAPPGGFKQFYTDPMQVPRYYSDTSSGRSAAFWGNLRNLRGWMSRSKPPNLHHRWHRHLAWWGPGVVTLAVSCWWWTNQATITKHWPGVLLRLPDAPHIALLALLPTMLVSPVAGGLWLRQRRVLAVFLFLLLSGLFTVGAVWIVGPLLIAVAGVIGLLLLAIIFGG